LLRDLVTDDNPWLALTRHLVAMHRQRRALRVGDLRRLVTDRLVGYQRFTDRAADMVVVLVNPSDESMSETVLVPDSKLPDSKLMDSARMLDLLGGPERRSRRSLVEVELPPHGCAVLAPVVHPDGGYSPFKRVQ
jgi:cyclomaltodextrinase